jgi:hypothetical protein
VSGHVCVLGYKLVKLHQARGVSGHVCVLLV